MCFYLLRVLKQITSQLSLPFIEDIQVFGVNMSFISLSEVKNFLYFISAEGTNEIYNFSLHEMK